MRGFSLISLFESAIAALGPCVCSESIILLIASVSALVAGGFSPPVYFKISFTLSGMVVPPKTVLNASSLSSAVLKKIFSSFFFMSFSSKYELCFSVCICRFNNGCYNKIIESARSHFIEMHIPLAGASKATGNLRKLVLCQLSELFVQSVNFYFERVQFFFCFNKGLSPSCIIAYSFVCSNTSDLAVSPQDFLPNIYLYKEKREMSTVFLTLLSPWIIPEQHALFKQYSYQKTVRHLS